ncbi:MAG: 16S rRNA (uracil(1498)-N(3))-methyltransferase [Verrucomicrobia bacterium]|nr:16S rRNA (uracil(1498)-N(3))-methyltransferase [Verrucomicrobiota bacterium]MBU4291689.1 16S rRNA (uracil(1498)-N(3))-methyltransferase [Verrucomicrobiota bacterium]MBU4430307.1 16S rRNA (uracil(1498)-N(3))-methyltransferase [Verrucomicrobiota bacterium]MCG2680418.1 16S rRNA (uracil(1498)-N(3))-methyltransferase [Kiritimatiellia bacterium]
MNRCFVEPAQWSQPEVTLSPEESRHLARVLRARPGDVVALMDGQGHTAQAGILAADPGGVCVRVHEETRHFEPPPSVSITLIQSIPRHALMDGIVQKATELGARAVWPLLTERVVARAGSPVAKKRRDRWLKIARESVKQSGVAWLPDIQPVMSLSEVLPRLPEFTVPFMASLHEEACPLRDIVKGMTLPTPMSLALIVGPEGDFTAEETLAVRQAGGLLVRFGPATLRVETAALYGLSVLTHEFSLG